MWDLKSTETLKYSLEKRYPNQLFESHQFNICNEQEVVKHTNLIFSEFKKLDILFNNAGYQGDFKNTIEYATDDFQKVMDINVIGAFIGALGAVMCAAFISINAGKTIPSLLLAGVATAAFLTSCQTYFMHKYYSSMQEIYSWIIGRLLTSGWDEVITITPYFSICFLIIYLFRKELDLLRLSEDEARMLGGNPNITYFIVLTASSLLTAVAVSLSGLIAFVGLVIPHIVRLTVSSSYRVMIPLSALVGGAFLTFADTFSRIVISPAELPIGIVTAFIGAPFFAFLLKASKGSF